MTKNILKGIIIGIANIIPGVSGGTMAVSMGIYDKLIHCISHFFSELKKNIIFLAPLAVGMVIAIIASAFGMEYLFDTFPVQTNFMFIGLILGSLPAIYGKVSNENVKTGHIISAVVFFLVVVGMAMLNGSSGHTTTIDKSFLQVIILFLIGVIAAATMVIPGVSGSMMLLMLGYYNVILESIKEFAVAVVHWNISAIGENLFILVPFGIGVIAGAVLISKIIETVFRKFPLYAYWSIIGLLIASPFAIIIVADLPVITPVRMLTGAVTFVAGFMISGRLGEK